ncbi:Pol polyprotein [Elysia marginata]|uniref:Pol polyprotein n=1 Tax=Elysia marginata TaxID=1093978 RepID=A0AAV4HJX0_9GAST|nr:Pol polyprotein [Elysia marginata]
MILHVLLGQESSPNWTPGTDFGDPQSRLPTTFLNPFGRFRMNGVPFRISFASKIFQRRMTEIFSDIDGVLCHMYDILVHAPTQSVHDDRVRIVLLRLQEAGFTFNEKCAFPNRLLDVSSMDKVSTLTLKRLREFENFQLQAMLLSSNDSVMVNQLTKFTPELATHREPLRQLLKKDSFRELRKNKLF